MLARTAGTPLQHRWSGTRGRDRPRAGRRGLSGPRQRVWAAV